MGGHKKNADVSREIQRAHLALKPERATDTVIVKLRTKEQGGKHVAVAPTGGSRHPHNSILASLVENGYAKGISAVFESDSSFSGDSRPRLAMAAALSPRSKLRSARGLVQLDLDEGTDPSELVRHLSERADEIEYAYVPAIRYPLGPKPRAKHHPDTPGDPLSARQWAHGAVRIAEARTAPGFMDADSVVVAVVDTGVDEDHPDLQGAIHSYTNYLSATEDKRDYEGHGTHVTGIIAGVMNNGIGIAGLCRAKVMMVKGLPRKGNRWVAKLYYQALAHAIDNGAQVLNLSLGGGEDQGEEAVIKDLIDAGITVVAAMGNEYERGNPKSYPAAYDGVIAVGAVDEVDRRAGFSCTGNHIALVAPGERILSTVPHYPSRLADGVLYDSWPGTSMACPHVAAAAALYLAKVPGKSPEDVKSRLTATADRVRWQADHPDAEYGHGRLNIAAALA